VIGSFDKADQFFVFCISDIFNLSDFKDQLLAKIVPTPNLSPTAILVFLRGKNSVLVIVLYCIRFEVFMAVMIHIMGL